ncbi:RIP metalloprotease RseP [Sodalis-like secondary symbiont of Drepanosiphum platanoidis]|uniref:RIP metalloprotease RseP n=1 Tax=Sodalis-like secondary symbiont of Drepanosiphum platanoidis TaxID=2994493 RepID=UPI003463A354
MIQFIFCFLLFIISIIILVAIHELGHFLFAKFFGIKVSCFSIGFGKKLYSWYDKNNTEYSISSIPLGGYVKMFGEPLSNLISLKKKENFNYIKIWKRFIIILSGPIFNFIFAIFLYWIIFSIGIINYRPIIYNTLNNSIAKNSGINSNMEIKSINGVKTIDWNSVKIQLIKEIDKKNICIEVYDFLKNITEKKILNLKKINIKNIEKDPIYFLGIIKQNPKNRFIISKINKKSSAEKSGLKIGDKLIKLNNIKLINLKNFKKYIYNNPYKIHKISIKRKKINLNIFLKPDIKILKNNKKIGLLGIKIKKNSYKYKDKIIYKFNILKSFIESIKKTYNLIMFTINILKKMLIGNIKISELNGPIYIAKIAKISVQYGLIYYLEFLALISINLGVINLFPLPILDGGHILLLIIEKIIKKPISKKIQNLIYKLSTIILIIFNSIAIFNDLSKI